MSVTRRIRAPTAAPIPIPILAPVLRPLLLAPAEEPAGSVWFDDWPAEVEDLGDPEVLDPVSAGELLPPVDPVPADLEVDCSLLFPVVCAGGGLLEAVGVLPGKKLMVSPVAFGSDATFGMTLEPLITIVVDAAIVQLQYEPGRSVVGLPSCGHGAQAGTSSHSVNAIHGWSLRKGQ